MTRTMSRRAPKVILLVVVCAITAWVWAIGQQTWRANVISMAAQKQVAVWIDQAAEPSPDQWADAKAALTSALSIQPTSPELFADLGDLEMLAGRREWRTSRLRQLHFAEAIIQYQASAALQPLNAYTWARLASAHQAGGTEGIAISIAWANALSRGPNEEHVQNLLLQVALATWSAGKPDMQFWAQNFYSESNKIKRQAINKLARDYGLAFELVER